MRGIEPIGAEGAPRSVHTEHRTLSSVTESNDDDLMPIDVSEKAQAMTAGTLMPETAAATARAAAPAEKKPMRRVNDGFLRMTRRMYKEGRNGQEILEANIQARIEAGYEKEKALARAKKDYGYVVWEAKATQAPMPAPLLSLYGSAIEDRPVEEARSNHSLQDEAILDQVPKSSASVGSRSYCGLISRDYSEYAGAPGSDPRTVSKSLVSEGIVRIIEVEGPVVVKRVYDIYLRGCGIRRMGHELKSIMNKALAHAIREGLIISEDEREKGGLLFSVVRVKGSPPIKLRTRGPRTFDEIPPSELNAVARYLAECHGLSFGSEEHMRAVLDWFDLKRLTTQVGTSLRDILNRQISYVDDFLNEITK